jgi:NitT/TauT family transport system ATP-binding protein
MVNVISPASALRTSNGIRVEFKGVQKDFDGIRTVDVARLSIEASSLTVLLGRSGCGKTTLLNMASGLDAPTHGEVLFDGEALIGPARATGLIFQQNNLFPWMSAQQNIVFALRNRGTAKEAATRQATQVLEQVGLASFAQYLPSRLSGGMRQRVALARAIAMEPRLLLLDEPFSALDAQTRRLMHQQLLYAWRQTGATILMVTHDLHEALQLADRIILMSSSPAGHIAQTIPVELDRPRNPDDAAFREIYRQLDAYLEHETLVAEHIPERSPDPFEPWCSDSSMPARS